MHNSWFCAGVFACHVKHRPFPVVPHAASAYLLYVILQKTDSIILGNLHGVSKGKKLATVRKSMVDYTGKWPALHRTWLHNLEMHKVSSFKGFYNV